MLIGDLAFRMSKSLLPEAASEIFGSIGISLKIYILTLLKIPVDGNLGSMLGLIIGICFCVNQRIRGFLPFNKR